MATTFLGLSGATGALCTRPQLPVILLLLALSLLLLTVEAVMSVDKKAIAPNFSTGGQVIIAGFVVHTFQIMVRMFADGFGNRLPDFDFGRACSYGECSRNVAFAPEWESYGHCIQGFLSILLFPATDGLITQQTLVPATRAVQLSHFISLGVTVYPIYNGIKRGALHGDTFAVSSFASNLCEWACGFVYGLIAGLCIETEMCRRQPSKMSESAFVRGARLSSPYFDRLRICFGLLLNVAAAAAAVLYKLSWQNATRDKEPEPWVALLMFIPIAIDGGWLVLSGVFSKSEPAANNDGRPSSGAAV